MSAEAAGASTRPKPTGVPDGHNPSVKGLPLTSELQVGSAQENEQIASSQPVHRRTASLGNILSKDTSETGKDMRDGNGNGINLLASEGEALHPGPKKATSTGVVEARRFSAGGFPFNRSGSHPPSKVAAAPNVFSKQPNQSDESPCGTKDKELMNFLESQERIGTEKSYASQHKSYEAEEKNYNYFTLYFNNRQLETAFKNHFNRYVNSKVQKSCKYWGILHVIVLGFYVVEMSKDDNSETEGEWEFSVPARLLIKIFMILSTLLLFLFSRLSFFHKHLDPCLICFYFLQSVVLNFLNVIHLKDSDFSSMPLSLCFIVVVFNTSGLKFVQAISVAGLHVLGMGIINMVFVFVPKNDIDNQAEIFGTGVALLVVMFSVPSSYKAERVVRQDFVHRCNISAARKRMDELLDNMLPSHITEELKAMSKAEGGSIEFKAAAIKNDMSQRRGVSLSEHFKSSKSSAEVVPIPSQKVQPAHPSSPTQGMDVAVQSQKLAKSFDSVTVLFCYISEFSKLQANSSAIALVDLLNRVFSTFDRATDKMGVYKVEAIGDTYLCVAGCPEADPHHSSKIADMALTMMNIVERYRSSWKINDQKIQIQIGIHTGPVVAGVVGSKSYSYHLFGDTVNTSSRMCSTSMPAAIHLSDAAYQKLALYEMYEMTYRGEIQVKGKGLMKTYWLVKKLSPNGFSSSSNLLQRKATSARLVSDRGSMLRSSIFDPSVVFDPTVKAMKNLSPDEHDIEDKVAMNSLTLQFYERPDIELAFTLEFDNHGRAQFRLISAMGVAVFALQCIYVIRHLEFISDSIIYRDAWLAIVLNMFGLLVFIAAFASSFDNPLLLFQQQIGICTCMFVYTIYPFCLDTRIDILTNIYVLIICVCTCCMRLRIVMIFAMIIPITIVFIVLGLHGKSSDLEKYADDEGEDFALHLMYSVLFILYTFYIGCRTNLNRERGRRKDFILERKLNREKHKCEELLANMLPHPKHAEALIRGETIVEELHDVTMLYSDIVGFTKLSATLHPSELCTLLNKLYSSFDRHLDNLGIYKLDTIGDAFVVIGGLDQNRNAGAGYMGPIFGRENHAEAVTTFAKEMLKEVNRIRRNENVDLNMRIGIHTGKAVGAVVGLKKPKYLIWGHDTKIANLMESEGVAGGIHLSAEANLSLKQSKFVFSTKELKKVDVGNGLEVQTFIIDDQDMTRIESCDISSVAKSQSSAAAGGVEKSVSPELALPPSTEPPSNSEGARDSNGTSSEVDDALTFTPQKDNGVDKANSTVEHRVSSGGVERSYVVESMQDRPLLSPATPKTVKDEVATPSLQDENKIGSFCSKKKLPQLDLRRSRGEGMEMPLDLSPALSSPSPLPQVQKGSGRKSISGDDPSDTSLHNLMAENMQLRCMINATNKELSGIKKQLSGEIDVSSSPQPE